MKSPRNGIGVDRSGGPVVDPTKNVEDLVQAGKESAADLRAADKELVNVRLSHVEFVAKLRASHEKEMFRQNNERLAALRLVDIATRNEDRKTADDAIRQLAAQTESLRQTLSKQVTDTAETLSKASQEKERATEVRIVALERASYTGAGEKAVTDPAMAQLVELVTRLSANSTGTSGERRGGQQFMSALGIIVTIIIAAGAVLVAVLK